MTPTARIYWDSCVIIDYLQKKADRYATLQEIINDARAGDIQLITSTLSRAEVFKFDEANPLSPLELQQIDVFFENEYVHLRDLHRFIGRNAVDISRQHGLHPPDAVHVATALWYKCHAMQTYDGCGSRKRQKHILSHNGKIGSPPLVIEEPRSHIEEPQKTKTLFEGRPDP